MERGIGIDIDIDSRSLYSVDPAEDHRQLGPCWAQILRGDFMALADWAAGGRESMSKLTYN